MSSSARFAREYPQRYRLEAGKCTSCGKIYFPPRVVCAECGNRSFETVRLSDKGKVLTYTVIRVAPSEFTDEAPYAVGVIELDDGVRFTAQIVDCDFGNLAIGMPVKVEFRRIQDEGEAGVICYGYKFVPA